MRVSPRVATTIAAILLSVLSAITQMREAPLQAAAQAGIAVDLNDLAERWGKGVEASIESAYRACFRTFVIGGRIVSIRIPFGENNDRAELAESDLSVQGGGKADPKLLWEAIAALIASPDFGTYADALGDGNEKAIVFDLSKRSWEVSRDLWLVARAKAGLYPGLPHKPVVLSTGEGIDSAAVYDYLFAVGGLGMDCSGFVWHSLNAVARAGGLDLPRALGRQSGGSRIYYAAPYIGTWFFTPKNKAFELVDEKIANLRPADIIVFRDREGKPVHSSVIQSIDRKAGLIRYLQSTDEAPRDLRGVHESFIEFPPDNPQLRLGDPEVLWGQLRESAFAGEPSSAFTDDGTRFRAWTNEGVYKGTKRGGGFVVRLKALAPAIKKLSKR
ncbi:MAG: peptidoglycan endopeptidase [Rectinemataceae bacterium]